MLIWVQRPNAEYVTSFKTIKDMGYMLNKDSKGIKIFIFPHSNDSVPFPSVNSLTDGPLYDTIRIAK